MDYYGKCGSKFDDRRLKNEFLEKKDFETILPKYRFYLSIENSRCKDYWAFLGCHEKLRQVDLCK